jgi:hypothetical protein
VKRVGKKMNCPVLDAFDLPGGDESVEHYGQHLPEGLHLSDSGNGLVCEGLMSLLQMDQVPFFIHITSQLSNPYNMASRFAVEAAFSQLSPITDGRR